MLLLDMFVTLLMGVNILKYMQVCVAKYHINVS